MTDQCGGWVPPDDDRRCTATSKGSGERCRRYAIPGGTVCAKHGGNASQVRRAAARRLMRERIHGELGPLLDDLVGDGSDADPMGVLLRAVARAEALAEIWTVKAGELDLTGRHEVGPTGGLTGPDHLGDEQVATAMAELRAANESAAKVSKAAVDAGLAERLVVLEEHRMHLMVAVIFGAVARALTVARAQLGDGSIPQVAAVVAGELGPAVRAELAELTTAGGGNLRELMEIRRTRLLEFTRTPMGTAPRPGEVVEVSEAWTDDEALDEEDDDR